MTIIGMVGGYMYYGKTGLHNAVKLLSGLYASDENKSFWIRVWEVIRRHSFEIIQTNVGYISAQFSNAIGKITDVTHFCGATFSHSNYRKGSIAFGNMILLSNFDSETKIAVGAGAYTTLHEYGHYLQSQNSGFAYLFKYGIPSAFKNRKWTEVDANLRAALYFKKHFDFDWNPNYYKGYRSLYSKMPTSKEVKKVKWWEWLVFPLTFLWN